MSFNEPTPCVACDTVLPLHLDDPDEYHWHVDAGMLVSTEAFRYRLQAKKASLQTFVANLPFRRSDEETILERFLQQLKIYKCGTP